MSTRARARSVLDQLAAVVDVDESHVGWWGLAWGVALLEGLGGGATTEAHRTLYHRANGGPHSDTFMGRPRNPSARVRDAEWASEMAFRALHACEVLDGRLPGQALRVHLAWRGRWLAIEPLPEAARRAVIFTVGGRHYRAHLEADAPAARIRLARSLEALAARRPAPGFRSVSEEMGEPLMAAAAVSLDTLHHDRARHTHRRCWQAGGGPWLGVARTPDLDVVTTCHLVVDGLGHALLTDLILPEPSEPARGHLPEEATPAAASPARRLPTRPVGTPATGVAWRYLAEGAGRFDAQAYVTGMVLDEFYGRGGHAAPSPAFTPSFTVPVAPGDDEERRMRRVLHGLLSVRRQDRGYEPFDSFKERLGTWLAQERAASGVLTRIASAVARSPLPRPLKHLALSNHHGPHERIPSVEALSGRARLSALRFPADAPGTHGAPLVAASLPTLLPTPQDPRGGVVLTLVHHDSGTTVTAFGTGRAGTASGAEAFLDLWLRTLRRVQG